MVLDKLYNVTKAAELLGVHRKTVYEWEKEGKFKFVKVGNFNKVKENDIRRLRNDG